ncbi:hypothetical protein [Loigolactobacillus binensis]|uniref:Uncharacterized protein n=1 Tax=Loigolactobacillus binensis TaxID=2559922 RepID=A0ABW3EG74_9LACO|nr:hypothetical protein [Loigolactobacillus binensis]
MATQTLSQLADYLEEHNDKIKIGEEAFDPQPIYTALDQLAILAKPVQDYFTVSEDTYYEQESDHLLTLQGGQRPLSELKDRIIVTHTDGELSAGDLRYNYAHEDAYSAGYDVQTDLHILTYGLEVIGATDNLDHEQVQKTLAKDAVLSLALAAKAVTDWQAAK